MGGDRAKADAALALPEAALKTGQASEGLGLNSGALIQALAGSVGATWRLLGSSVSPFGLSFTRASG